jgi:CDP-paratose 2-epimerase
VKYLITGGCGFLGSNLAVEALARKSGLAVFDNLSRKGAAENLAWLQSRGRFDFVKGDIRDRAAVDKLVADARPDVIFHLAGQVAMTTSLADPRLDFEVNAGGSFSLLEAARKYAPDAAIIYSSTNKVYGDLEWAEYREDATRYTATAFPDGFPETVSLDFHSPYGCSKGSADQYMLDFSRMFGLKTIVFRHSSMFGGRQFSTFDQGWIGWFCSRAIEAKKNPTAEPFTISGNGKQVRDVLYASDMVSLYFSAAENIGKAKGQAFNIGGGMANSLSLLELFAILEAETGAKLRYAKLPPRESDQKVFVADIRKAEKYFGWKPAVDKVSGVRKMLAWQETI